jgi:hypothetical protein
MIIYMHERGLETNVFFGNLCRSVEVPYDRKHSAARKFFLGGDIMEITNK